MSGTCKRDYYIDYDRERTARCSRPATHRCTHCMEVYCADHKGDHFHGWGASYSLVKIGSATDRGLMHDWKKESA